MIPYISLVSVFSRMTLAVAKDSGWFAIDLDLGEQFNWGKRSGCRMFDLEKEHEPIGEFCRKLRKKTCSRNGKFIDMCRSNPFSFKNHLKVPYKSCQLAKLKNKFSQFDLSNDSACLTIRVGAFVKPSRRGPLVTARKGEKSRKSTASMSNAFQTSTNIL